jgi:antitoxin CptB
MGYSAAPFSPPANPDPMDDRRKKLRFRAWRRGFREIDLILGGFADSRLIDLDAPQLDAFERLLDAPDQDVYDWITEQRPPPREHDTSTLALIRAFRLELHTSE